MGGYVGVETTYTPIEYIESTGTQSINTGYTPLAHDKIVVDCLVKLNDRVSYEALFGTRASSYMYNAYVFFTRFNASNIPTYNRTGAETQGSNMIYNERITLTTQDSVATWTNGTNTYTCTTTGTVEDCTYPLYVFDLNNGGPQDGSKSHVKLYSLKIYDENDNLVRDFTPVLYSDGVAGLWENVESRPYYNQGTGEFLYPEANTNDYDVLDYIESSGTQYLDIGFYANNNTRVEAEAMPTNISGGEGWQALFSSKTGYHNKEYVVQVDKSAAKWYTAFGGTSSSFTAVTNNYNYYIDKNKNVTTINGATNTLTNSTFTATQPMYIFTDNESGPTHYFRGRLFWLKVYDDGTLIRHLVPAKRKSDDEICMYDLVNNQFYTNAGTGVFTGGDVVGARGVPTVLYLAKKLKKGYVGVTSTYTPVEYIESSGTQYIDTGHTPTENTKIVCKLKTAQNMLTDSNVFAATWNASGFTMIISNQNPPKFMWHNGSAQTLQNAVADTEYVFEVYQNNVKINDVQVLDTSYTTQTYSDTIKLFGMPNQQYMGNYKLNYFKVYENNTLVRDFSPVVDDNNVACLWDKVESRAYYNAGSGTFTVGSATGESDIVVSKARKIKTGYVGVNGVARLVWGGLWSDVSTFTKETNQSNYTMVTATKDYVIVAGGQANSTNPNTTVSAYNIDLVRSAAPTLSTGAMNGQSGKFNGYGVVGGGVTSTSWSSRTSNCYSYDNSLVKTQLTGLAASAYEGSMASTSAHLIFSCGSVYNYNSTSVQAYDTSFVSSNLTASSGNRRGLCSASIGNYVVLCGAESSSTATDFYNDSNVKTTATNPYNATRSYTTGIGTNSHAMFFGGSSSSDIKAYDTNLVVASASLPVSGSKFQGFASGDKKFALIGVGSNTAYYYNSDLLIEETITIQNGGSNCRTAESADDFGIFCIDWSTVGTQIK